VMNNPMTVKLIEEKCLDWVQKSYTTGEARRLARLQEEKKPSSPAFNKPQEKK